MSELEWRSTKTSQNENIKKKKKGGKKDQKIKELWSVCKTYNICVIGAPKGEEREDRIK